MYYAIKKIHRHVVFTILLFFLQTATGYARVLVIDERTGYEISQKIYSSVSQYQCLGWNIFYTDAASNKKMFFFIKYFYSYCLMPQNLPAKACPPKFCDIKCLADSTRKLKAVQGELVNDRTVLTYDSLIVYNSSGAWYYPGATVLEMFFREDEPISDRHTNQSIINLHLQPLSEAPQFSIDSVHNYSWSKFAIGVKHYYNSNYLIYHQKNNWVFGRTGQNCKDCRIFYNKYYVFDPAKGIVKFFGPYCFLPGPNMRWVYSFNASHDMYWFE